MEILEILNPWWKEKGISNNLALPYRRSIFPEIMKLAKLRQITIISGLRRVGKSTIMYQLTEDLLKNTMPEKILYYSFDERAENIVDILEKYSQLTGTDWKKEKCFIFFDEIQKLADWSSKLKIVYDGFPNLKIIVSGSSSFQLEREAKANLAGRHFVANVEPLSYAEYLELKKSKIDLGREKLWDDEIKREFRNYLLRPFPEIVGLQELSLIKSYIKDNVIEKVLKIDLPKRFRNINEELLSRLIDIFYERPGTYINYDELSNDLKISKKTLLQHIYYLEFAYIIRRVKNFRPKMRTTSRKMQRVYPYHWSLGFGWTGKTDFGTIAASLLDAKYYWRKNGKEIDFLLVGKQILPVKVKESAKVTKGELRHMLFFMKNFGLKEGMLVYSGNEEKAEVNGFTIKKMPLWKLSLME